MSLYAGQKAMKWPWLNWLSLKKKSIPGIIGAIDCTNFQIDKPGEHPVQYFNRSRYYSIKLQAIVDADLKFRDISCGEPGSMHDARVLRRSIPRLMLKTSCSQTKRL